MLIPESIVLLPCHSLEDFPTYHRSTDADSLLACWTVAWHPWLIGQTGQVPAWRRADEPGHPAAGSLILVPTVSRNWLPSGYRDLAEREQARLFEGQCDRTTLLEAIFTAYDLPTASDRNWNQALIGDFFALGYAFLQVQLMTRQLRGSTNLDEQKFATATVAAAAAWNETDAESTVQNLARCFDLLLAEKNAYYPVQPELLDLVLTADTTLGKSLTRELESDHPKSMLMSGETGRRLQSEQPENFQRLRQLVVRNQINIIGGMNRELEDPLLSAESTVLQIRAARKWFRLELGGEVDVFARRSFGLTANLPAILDAFDFVGALHCTMSGGTIPVASTGNIRWEAADGSSIFAFAQTPEDANEGHVFLKLAVRLGQASDSAHVASVLLTHWPDRVHFCFQDLLRIGSYGSLFGKFRTLKDYFEAVYDPGYGDTYTADEYRGEFLKSRLKSHQPNPISTISNYWKRTFQLRSLRAAVVQLIVGTANANAAAIQQIAARLDDLQSRTDVATQIDDAAIDQDILTTSESLIRSLAGEVGDSHELSVVNTTNVSRIVRLQTANRNAYAKFVAGASSVRFADSQGDRTDWILDLPPMSITPLDSRQDDRKRVRKEPRLGHENRLRNEFFELTIDTKTGGILSVDKYDRRKNLMTQQLSLRIPAERGSRQQRLTTAHYARMVCDDLILENESRARARITTRGRLIDGEGDSEVAVAEFNQSVTVCRGIPLIELEIDLSPGIELAANPNHYFCSRLAWKHDSAELYRSVQETRAYVMEDHFEAPNWIEVRGPNDTLTVLTGGLPFHRRSSRRMLDSLLLVAGETQRRFRLGLGINLKYPYQAAADFLTPPLLIPRASGAAMSRGWLFHFNCKNVLATWWSPQFDEQNRCTGVEIRCCETEERGGDLEIYCPFRLTSARRVSFGGDHLHSLDTAENIATTRFRGGEYFQLQLNWNP
jgi:alpha-mannosidase